MYFSMLHAFNPCRMNPYIDEPSIEVEEKT
jgi:hypothetical protein